MGADLPLLLIFAGVIGGLLSFGLVGIFIGPVVLAVAYTLLVAWVEDADEAPTGATEPVQAPKCPRAGRAAGSPGRPTLSPEARPGRCSGPGSPRHGGVPRSPGFSGGSQICGPPWASASTDVIVAAAVSRSRSRRALAAARLNDLGLGLRATPAVMLMPGAGIGLGRFCCGCRTACDPNTLRPRAPARYDPTLLPNSAPLASAHSATPFLATPARQIRLRPRLGLAPCSPLGTSEVRLAPPGGTPAPRRGAAAARVPRADSADQPLALMRPRLPAKGQHPDRGDPDPANRSPLSQTRRQPRQR